MDPLYLALSYFRKRKFEKCVDVCSSILKEQADDRAWLLKMRALTLQVSFDDVEVMESLVEGPESMHQQTALTATARPGTSLRKLQQTAGNSRPQSQGRLVSGVVRLNRNSETSTATSRDQLRSSKIQTANRVSRLGTASMAAHSSNFINVARLNLTQYAAMKSTAKPLFEYLYFVAGDVKNALELANQALALDNANNGGDELYWKCAVNRCLMRLSLVREVIQGTNSDWYTKANCSEGIRLMAKAYVMMDQPLAAVDIYRKGIEKFPKETSLLLGIARIYEELNQMENSIDTYKKVLTYEASNVEAVACLAAHFFSNGTPELALILYRRLLQMGVHTAEVFNNIALCCLQTQQFDLIFPCIEKALMLAQDVVMADVWFNCGHIALSSGKLELASICWKLALSIDKNHSKASNNLGVLAAMSRKTDEAHAHFNSAMSFDELLIEAKLNLIQLALEKEDNETALRLSKLTPTENLPLNVTIQLDIKNT